MVITWSPTLQWEIVQVVAPVSSTTCRPREQDRQVLA
jgi:hypothetical protein